MDNWLTKEQKHLRERVRQFLSKEVTKEAARRFDENEEYPQALFNKLAEYGLTAVNVPKQYGGDGGGDIECMIMAQEMARVCPVLSWAFSNVRLYGNNIISANGSPEQKQRYLPRLARGELRFAFGLTEPGAGSDAAGIRTKAVPVDEGYLINGSKIFITGATVSDFVVTFARTAPSRYRGITAFLVSTDSQGIRTRSIDKLGYRGSATAEVYYDDVTVKPSEILGGEHCLNQGWDQMVRLLNGERLVLAASGVGIGEAVLSEVVAFVRGQGNGPVTQSVQHRVADMATELEAARQLLSHAGQLVSRGVDCVRETSMAKYFCTETAKKLAMGAMEILGGHGYSMDSDVQRFFRDVLVLTIGGGTTQIQKNIVAKTLGL